MRTKTARRFLNRNRWKLASDKIFSSSFYRRVNQAKVTLGANPLKLAKDTFADRLARMFQF